MSLDDRIRAAARELDGSTDLAASVSAYWQVEERYRTEMATAAPAAALHRRAVGVDAYLHAEEAAREGRTADANALFADAARCGIGDPADSGHEREEDPLDAVVAAAAAGGRLAREIVLQEIRPFVRALCAVVSGSRSVDELTRLICGAVVAALPEYVPQIPFLEFVHDVAFRCLATFPTSPTAHGSTAGPREAVARMLRQLPAKQCDVLVLRILMGFSAERTAEILRTTPGAVRVAQHKALARLRDGLDQPPADELPPAPEWPSIRLSGVDRDDPEGVELWPRRPSRG
jgi:RNA polymerase sigma-70 factor (ECF subfamily)